MRDEMQTRLDLFGILEILLLRWRVIATALLASLALGFLGTLGSTIAPQPESSFVVQEPPTYSATAVYALVPEESGLPVDERLRLAKALAPTYLVVLSEESLLAEIVNTLGVEVTVDEIRSGLSLSNPPGTSLLNVSVITDAPNDAVAIANGFGDALSRRFGSGGLDIGVLRVQLQGFALAESADAINPQPVATTTASEPRVNPIAIFTLIGLVIGVLGAFIVEWTEGKSHRTAQVAEETGLHLLGKLSNRNRPDGDSVIEVHSGDGEEAESFRAMKARLKLISPSDALGRSILVTSPNAGAGKTTVVGNLAHTLAEDGSTVVVVSADLRSNDVVERYWPQQAGSSGLSDYLVEPDLTVQKILCQTSESGVSLITRGSSSEGAIPLLDSRRMVALIDELSEKFDWVLIDSPATIGSTDAARLAPSVDGTLLVVDGARGTIASVQSAARFLDDTGAKLIGFFHNRARRNPVDRILRRPSI